MKRIFSRLLSACVLAGLTFFCLPVMGFWESTASSSSMMAAMAPGCIGGIGGQFYSSGQKYKVTILPYDAGMSSSVYLISPQSIYFGSSFSVNSFGYTGEYAAGTELIFALYGPQGYWLQMGPGSRNADGRAKANVQCQSNGGAVIGFEDWMFGGDNDFNDAMIRIDPQPFNTTTTVTVGSATYDGSPHGATAVVTGGGGLNQSLTVMYSGRNGTNYPSTTTPPTNAGFYTASASFSGSSNYNASSDSKSFTIFKAQPNVNFTTVAPAALAFNGTYSPAATTNSDGALTLGASGACSIANGIVTINAGSGICTVTASVAETANYLGGSATAQQITAVKADQTITFTGAPASEVYGNSFEVAFSASSGLSVSVAAAGGCSIAGTIVSMTSGTNACVLTASQGGDANYNAALDAVQTTGAQKAAATISLSNLTQTYTGTPRSVTAQTNPAGLSSLSITYDGSTSAPTSAGSYAVAASLANENYEAAEANDTLVIEKAALTVTADSVSKQYSDSMPNFTYAITGFVNGEMQSNVVSGEPMITTTANQFSGPGSYALTLVQGTLAAANYSFMLNNGTATSGVLTVTEEDADVFYSGPEYFATASPTSDTAQLTLSATVIDMADGARGDIRNAQVEFYKNSPAGQLLGTANVGLINSSTTDGTATISIPYKLSGSEADGTTFNVYAVVKNWYTGATGGSAIGTVTISKPGSDFVSGGGNLILQTPMGTFAGDVGSKMNFGFTMKYNKSGKNLQGQANIIVRGGGRVYQIKSNAIESLAVSGTGYPRSATFITKANMTDITDPTNPIPLEGNLKLQLEMKDTATGGQTDEVSVTVWNANGGMYFSSTWNGTKTILQQITGGNISVR